MPTPAVPPQLDRRSRALFPAGKKKPRVKHTRRARLASLTRQVRGRCPTLDLRREYPAPR